LLICLAGFGAGRKAAAGQNDRTHYYAGEKKFVHIF
jgi:hypothetical protein